MTSEEKAVLYTEDGHVALIALNRPKAMNASSRQLRADLTAAMEAAEKNDDIRVVVLTGEGRGFSAGADLTEPFTEHHETITDHILADHKPIVDFICNSNKTYIAALNGATAGVSVAYALACDLVIMAESAFIYSPFAAISLVPDGGVSWFLLQSLGYYRAYQMIIEGGRLTAAECEKIGLANKVASDEELRSAALAWANDLATKVAPLTMRYGKQALRTAQGNLLQQTIQKEAELQHLCDQSSDFKEGVTAFFEKRKPNFSGK